MAPTGEAIQICEARAYRESLEINKGLCSQSFVLGCSRLRLSTYAA